MGEDRKGWKGDEVVIGRDIEKGDIEREFIVNWVNYEKGDKVEWSKEEVKELKEGWKEERWEEGLDVGEKGKRFGGEVGEERVGWRKER